MQTSKVLTRGLMYLFLIVATGLVFYPTLYMALAAFTTPDRLLNTVLLPIPNTFNLDFLVEWWNIGLWQAYVFTLLRCLFYIALGLFVGLFGGYIFSKLNFPGRHKLFLLFLKGFLFFGELRRDFFVYCSLKSGKLLINRRDFLVCLCF